MAGVGGYSKTTVLSIDDIPRKEQGVIRTW